MTEITFSEDQKKGWVYSGRDKEGKPKFKRYTNQSLEHVKSYLDERGLAYIVYEAQRLMFIYKEKEPECQYSSRYAYYYSTGRWGSPTRRKHYHSEGIEHFIETYYKGYD